MPDPTGWRITWISVGVGPEALVGVYLEDGVGRDGGSGACGNSQGGRCPRFSSDPGYPEARLASVLTDAGTAPPRYAAASLCREAPCGDGFGCTRN